MALGIMLVLTIVLTAVITFTAAGARDSTRVNSGQKAYALAEAGVNNALAVLNANYPDTTNAYPGPRCVLNPQTPPADFPGTEPALPACAASTPFTSVPDSSRPSETVTWWGRLRRVTGMGIAWVIHSTGSVPNPTGPGASPVRRTVQAKVPVIIGPAQDVPPGVLNWLYSYSTATVDNSVSIRSPFYTRGNLDLGNGVDVTAPIYVTCVMPPAPVPTPGTCGSAAGNVLMSQTGKILRPATVAIGGYLRMETDGNNGNRVGESGAKVSEAHIVNGCKWKNEPVVAPCVLNRTDKVRVYADAADRVMPADPIPNPPVIDWNFWYQYGSPGPNWGCDAGTTPRLENEAAPSNTLNNSVPTLFNLLQGTSYSCKTLSGELTWDATSRVLTVDGTIYIDGSLEVARSWSGQEAALYQGQGTIFMSGSLKLQNTVKLCAVVAANGTDCNISTGAWDPNINALIFVAKSKGSDPGVQAASGSNSVEANGAQFQGVLGGEHNIVSENFSVIQGPVISLQGSLNLSQTSGASFPDIRFAPSGAPGNPPPPSVLLTPRDFGGG